MICKPITNTLEAKLLVKPTLNIAVILHMHQPLYSFTGKVLDSETAREVFVQTMHPYTFPPEAVEKHDGARVTLNFTGTLIEQMNELAAAEFDSRLEGIWSKYRRVKDTRKVEFTGCGYFHPILPMIPEADRRKQIEMHLKIYEKTFGGKPVGFWPPEVAFNVDLVPLLADMGFQWAIVDEPHVTNVNKGKDWRQLLYHPHYVERGGRQITIVVRDRGISIAQQSGYDPSWLMNEVQSKLKGMPKKGDEDLLLVVATDGENGWFRHSGDKAGFWGCFFIPLLEKIASDPRFELVKLTTVQDYLRAHPPEDTVNVESGSWNVQGMPDDGRFLKWTGDAPRKQRWEQIAQTNECLRKLEDRINRSNLDSPKVKQSLREAWRWMLTAESSDYFYWGIEEWLSKCSYCCERAQLYISEVEKLLSGVSGA